MTTVITSKEQFDALPDSIRWHLFNRTLANFVVSGATLDCQDTQDILDSDGLAEEIVNNTQSVIEFVSGIENEMFTGQAGSYVFGPEMELQMRIEIANIVLTTCTTTNATH